MINNRSMKYILPLLIAVVSSLTGYAQDQFPNYTGIATWNGSVPGYSIMTDSGAVTGTKAVQGVRFRINGVTYNHTTPDMLVPEPGTGWLTQFNHYTSFGNVGNNVDNFQYQGTTGIRGNGNVAFDDVYFNNGAGNTMNISNYIGVYDFVNDNYNMPPCGILVAKTLYFNNGITTTNRNYPIQGAIAFTNSATYVNSGVGLSDAQHVDGFVSEFTSINNSTGALGHGGSFVFPVGNATEVHQLQRTGTIDEYERILTVGWVDGDPDSTTDLTGIFGQYPDTNFTSITYREPIIASIIPIGFWDWHYQDIYDDNYTALPLNHSQVITVSIPDLQSISVGAADLRLVGWDANNSRWINLSGTTGASGLTKGSTLSGTIPAGTNITALAIGSISVVLPVSFTDFSVKTANCKALLEWRTQMEFNNSHFNVERSQDGVHFTTIARVNGAGNSNTLKTYNYTDETPFTGKSYYRITQVDYDGKNSSTPIEVIEMNCDNVSLKVYPNPAVNQITIKTNKAIVQVHILSSNGQSVIKHRPSLNPTGGIFTMNIQAIQSGIYFVQIINRDGTTELIKLLKK